ncbi:hypothetical protein CLIB1444_02S17304 [[Candida] jaroonii]|uniref:Uncharacterized protein n=1 Tax=[Candida] jaroonii TaxID=467808 RepID=A0ACA9Y614_9ASCO|nr:hypothetical protein CLIB1444_02S17304 [[Candida] jaroonii]
MMYNYHPTTYEKHIDIGSFKGLHYEELNTKQVLGVPFATVPGRFRKSQLNDNWAHQLDGTKLGPSIPQVKRPTYPIPVYDRPWLNVPGSDEFGLNLNISIPEVPKSGPEVPKPGPESEKLPVMVFIHGGANTYGAGNSCIFDGLQLAHLSYKLGKPTIVVTFNYRLGSFGFLASKDLKEYNSKFGENGVGNYGISDQRNALLWVNKYIEYFGGDKSKITLFGQSAGSQASHLMVLKDEGLFNRVILQSGLTPLCGVFTVEQYDVIYFKLLKKLGIDTTLSPEERVKALVETNWEDLMNANEEIFPIPCVTMAYTEDNEVLPSFPSWKDLGKKVDHKILIGDCANECIIWSFTYKDMTANDFIEVLYDKCSSKEVANTFIDLYGIKSDLSKDEIFHKIEDLTSDAMFRLPNYLFYNANPSSLVYHFKQTSTYNHDWNGYAHHSLDNVYVWNLLKESLHERDRPLSDQMSKSWVLFANGVESWEPYGEHNNIMVFGEEGKSGLAGENRHKVSIWKKIIDLGLVEEFGRVCEDICLARTNDHGYV